VLRLFIEYLSNLRNPHLKLLLGHASDCEAFLHQDTEATVRSLIKRFPAYSIPALTERAEDIPVICQQILANLRTAHPFLLVGSITADAIDYLVSQRSQLSHSKLVRVLRNAIALSQRTSLSVEDIKNYGESDTTTQHLLESMADESYFPDQSAAIS